LVARHAGSSSCIIHWAEQLAIIGWHCSNCSRLGMVKHRSVNPGCLGGFWLRRGSTHEHIAHDACDSRPLLGIKDGDGADKAGPMCIRLPVAASTGARSGNQSKARIGHARESSMPNPPLRTHRAPKAWAAYLAIGKGKGCLYIRIVFSQGPAGEGGLGARRSPSPATTVSVGSGLHRPLCLGISTSRVSPAWPILGKCALGLEFMGHGIASRGTTGPTLHFPFRCILGWHPWAFSMSPRKGSHVLWLGHCRIPACESCG
jgi:hypothetical protein